MRARVAVVVAAVAVAAVARMPVRRVVAVRAMARAVATVVVAGGGEGAHGDIGSR